MQRESVAKAAEAERKPDASASVRREAPALAALHPALQLQRTAGNRAVGRFLQAKLHVGRRDDRYEHEADRVADQVMRMPASEVAATPAPPQVSRKCNSCEEKAQPASAASLAVTPGPAAVQPKCATCAAEDEERVRAKPAGATAGVGAGEAAAPASVAAAVARPGRALDRSTRAFFEPRFGHSLADVRVHSDAAAGQSAESIGARAYAVGRDIAFAPGEFAPHTPAGRWLLAHEIAHVLQQTAGGDRADTVRREPNDGKLAAAGAPAAGAGRWLQRKVMVGALDDPLEREADQVASVVMRMPAGDPVADVHPIAPARAGAAQRGHQCAACGHEADRRDPVRRLCAHCDGLQQHGGDGETPAPGDFAARFAALRGGGEPMAEADRTFFEPRFGHDFTAVRLHTGPAANELAHSVQARAFTFGDSIVFGSGEYAPGSTGGRQLLAHELVHVAQQGGGAPTAAVVRRQTMHASCSTAQRDLLRAAWTRGQELTEQTIQSLENELQSLGYGAGHPTVERAVRNAFGEVGFVPGDLTFLPELIRRYRTILGAFQSGRTLRCDPTAAGTGRNECDWRSAFVVVGNARDVFICDAFFATDVTVTSRGLTLLHELAHSVLHIAHAGIAERTYPPAFFDCTIPLDVAWEDAKRNAFAYELLANCLHGERPTAEVESNVRPRADRPDPRWSFSAAAGAGVTPGAQRFAAALGGRLALRSGEFVVFNPVIGVNLLYLPQTADAAHLLAATADIGVRIQQPVRGFYVDVSAGGFAGVGFDPHRESPTRLTGGPTAAAGLGWRWERLELGAETRALVPEADFDRTHVLVLGRAALRL